MRLNYFLNKLQDVKFLDYLSALPMLIAMIFKPFFKKRYSKCWLICEEPAEARDNGYHFFKYMCEKHPEQKCYYAIKKESVDYPKVRVLGDIIQYGSIQHWLAFLLCEYNISSQKGGKPNAAMCAFFEMNGIIKVRNVFLQHGITKDHAEWLYADKCNFEYFITAAIPEDKMIKEDYGYKDGIVQLMGFPRYDALITNDTREKIILIMPTWRNWFNLKSKGGNEIQKDFSQSYYLHAWMDFLLDDYLHEIIKKNCIKVIFFIHRNLQKYIDFFEPVQNDIIIASWKKYDIQDLLKLSSLMITDYSSVYFDMIYMNKPILFYQFDENDYRKYQYKQGWFDYHNNPFSESYQDKTRLLNKLEEYVKCGFEIDAKYKSGRDKLFRYNDCNNSKRVFELLSNQ